MPRAPVETQEKSCEWCGSFFNRSRMNGRLEDLGVFRRRRFCSISCSVLRQHATEPPTVAASRKRSRRLKSTSCEACGVPAELSVHHVDGNPMNNDWPNLQTLCLSCHSFWHSVLRRTGTPLGTRMPRLIASAC